MGKHSPDISVFIPDGERDMFLTLQVVYCLAAMQNIKVYVMSAQRQNFIKFSRYVEGFTYFPKTSDEEWINKINYEVEKFEIDIIMPIYEDAIRKLLENKELINNEHKLVLLPTLQEFQIAADKGLLYEHLKKNNLPAPVSQIIKPNKFPKKIDLIFPIIAKPVKGFGGGNSIKVLRNEKELVKYFQSKTFKCDTILQNYINGHDLSCNVLCVNGEIIAHSIQKVVNVKREKLAPLTGFSFVENKDLFKVLTNLMSSLNWSGVANIDFRYDILDRSHKIIEINPRFWINVDASAIAGVNFPHLICLFSTNQKYKINNIKHIDYLNLKGLVKEFTKKPFKIFDFNFMRSNTPLIFALTDPLPMIYKFVWRTKNVIVRKLGGNQ